MAQQAMYEQMVFPTRFMWGYGGKQVRARPRISSEFHASTASLPFSSCCTPRACRGNRGVARRDRRSRTRAEPPRSRPRLTHPIANARRSTCAGRSLTGWRRCRWPPSPRPTGAACSRWCATCRRGTTSTSSSWMASGGTTRTRRSSRILWVTSTTGASIDQRARPPPARAQRPAATKPIPQNPPPRANNNPRFFPDGMPFPPLPDTDPRY